jgi:hypothetical protein
VIIRISASRVDDPRSETWWNQARRSAERGEAPHGIGQVVMDEAFTHVDVFVSESSEVWRWAERFENWKVDGRAQLSSEPLESTKSEAVSARPEQLRAFPAMRKQR